MTLSFSQLLHLNNQPAARDKTSGITKAIPKNFNSEVPRKQAQNTNLLMAWTTVIPGAVNRAERICVSPKESVQYRFVPQ
jgi:hypothetical protein